MKRIFGQKAFIYVFFIVCFQIILTYALVYEWAITRLKLNLNTYTTRIAQDLQYHEGKWDTTAYRADPLTPHPSGSSGFIQPLYIVSTDGFVIERSNPIAGYLDASDTKHLLAFQKVTTLNSVTNERWRVQTKPMIDEGRLVGVVTAAYFDPGTANLQEIDRKIASDTARLLGLIKHDDRMNLDVSAIDIRHVNYDISFEVVDRYNKVLINNGRTPSFIDKSYVIDEINGPAYSIIRDSKTDNAFLIHRYVLQEAGQPVGIVVTGFHLNDFYSVLNVYLALSLLTAFMILLPVMYFILKTLANQIPQALNEAKVEDILFDRETGVLTVNDQHTLMPYASNQYYLLDAIMMHPKKRWEQDELLEKLGEITQNPHSRIVYDTMLAINRKTGIKVVEYKDKTYRFNPAYLSQLKTKKY